MDNSKDLFQICQLKRHGDYRSYRFEPLDQISRSTQLRGAIVEYARTRSVFFEYKACGYSDTYLAEHQADLSSYRASQATFRELMNGESLPKMADLRAEL